MDLTIKPRVAALICVLLWSLIAAIAKLGQRSLDFYQFLFASNLVSLLAVLLATLMAGRSLYQLCAVKPSLAAKAVGLGVLDCLFYLAIYRGYSLANGVAVLVAQYSWPLMIVGLSSMRDSRWPNWREATGLLAGVIAILLAVTKGDIAGLNISNPGALMIVLAGAFCFALLSTLSKSSVSDPFIGTVWLFASSTCLSFLLLVSFSSLRVYASAEVLPILLNGVLINGLSYILWVVACAKGDAIEIASLAFLSPVLSAIWLVSFFHEKFVPAYAAALALALVSGILCLGCERRSKEESASIPRSPGGLPASRMPRRPRPP